MAALIWGMALVTAVALPSRVVGPLDGAPFDTALEVVALAVLLPALWRLYPGFLKTAGARAIVLLLLTWKVVTWATVPQGGWCADFSMKNPPETGGWRLTRSWDARTVWESTPASCSAIMARGYQQWSQFPGWAINIPYGRDRWLHAPEYAKHRSGDFLDLSQENPRPPAGEYRMDVRGAFDAKTGGTFTLLTDRGVTLAGEVDGRPLDATANDAVIDVGPGWHEVDLRLALTSLDWRFVPLWNGSDLFSALVTTTTRVSGAVSFVHRVGRWIVPSLIVLLLTLWTWTIFAGNPPGIAAVSVVGVVTALLVGTTFARGDLMLPRMAVAALAACVVAPLPGTWRNARGAWLLIGVPWLALIAAMALPQVGHFTVYTFGDDPLTYQRFAHRIYMEHFWLEGGQPTFWNQPLYRWICGALHLVFGDSSAGEIVWDGFGLLVGSMFAFVVVNRIAGFRIGLAAAVAALVTVAVGPNWYLIGRGLSEISASMWIYLALCCLVTAEDKIARGVLAGVFGALAYYTRMNHLPLVLALGAVVIVDHVDVRSARNVRLIWQGLPKKLVGAYYATLAIGLCLFAARTWYYTRRFSLFAGTQLGLLGIGFGNATESWWSMDALRRAAASLAMLITVQDPPRFDPRSILVVAGVLLSMLCLMRVPLARRLPLGISLVCVAAIVGGLAVRGSAYPGRFSVHLIPVAVAASMMMLSLSLRDAHR